VQGFQGGRALHKAVFGFQRLVGESRHPLSPPRLRGVPHPQPPLLFPGGDRGHRDCRGGFRFAPGGEGKEEGDTGSEVRRGVERPGAVPMEVREAVPGPARHLQEVGERVEGGQVEAH